MLDIQLLRNDLAAVAERLATRGYVLDMARFAQLMAERKAIQMRTQELQAKRNAVSKQIGQAKAGGEDVLSLMAEAGALDEEWEQHEAKQVHAAQGMSDFLDLLAVIPNLPHESVPVGKSEADNVEMRKVGTPTQFDFEVKDHVELGEKLGLDFDTAAKISGARFSVLKGGLARLHRALSQFMLDTHTDQHGYTET